MFKKKGKQKKPKRDKGADLRALERDRARRAIEKAKIKIQVQKQDGINVGRISAQLAHAQLLYKNGVYGQSREIADSILWVASDIQSRWGEAKTALDKAKQRIEQDKKRNINVSHIMPQFQQANRLFSNGDYTRSKQIAESILWMASDVESRSEPALTAISKAKQKIAEYRRKNINVEPIVAQLQQAEKYYQSGNYTKASEVAENALWMASSVEELWEQARNTIEVTGIVLEAKKQNNINVDTVLPQLQQAKVLFEKGNYAGSKEMAEKAFKDAGEIEDQWRESNDALSSTSEKIKEAISKGMPLTPKMAKAKRLFSQGKYKEAEEVAWQIQSDLVAALKKYDNAFEVVAKAEAAFKALGDEGITVDQSFLNEVKEAIENQEYDKAMAQADTIMEKVEELKFKSDKAKVVIHTCMEDLKMAEQYIFVDDIKTMLDDAAGAMQEGEFDKAISLARNCEDTAVRLVQSGKPIISIALPTNLQARIFNRCKITVTNSGKAHAGDVDIHLSGKVETDGLIPIPMLKANESIDLEFALKSDVEGSIPITVTVNCINMASDEPVTSQDSAWLNIGEIAPVQWESEVKVLRETEFFRGFVRMKVAVQNGMQAVLTDVAFRLIYEDKIFRFSHVEPDYIIKNGEIQLGNVNPKEKKTVAIYLDPLICTDTNIDGAVSYKDAGGHFNTTTMKPKEVKIICPIFFTEDTANVAMLMNLVKEGLPHQDSKVFNIPLGVEPAKAFEITKEAIGKRDIKHIRDYCQKYPFVSEAWYYGVTKVKKYQIVISCDVEEETNSIKIFAASSDEKALTGLLAELGHNLETEMKEKGISEPIQQITNITIKDTIIQRSSLLFGTEGECDMKVEDSVVLKSKLQGGKKGAQTDRDTTNI
ncbi:MAG: hypothetical protein JSW28_10600 [Thermoplasmata archaeon]|nr:MAG: hypothetical protein JSW28_10600 [Thermoplasmata archaeon]